MGVGVQPSEERKEMNKISRDLLVIFLFLNLVVKGDVL